MEVKDYFLAHIKDLAYKADKENIITSSLFLSLSEQNIFLKKKIELIKEYGSSLKIVLDGGNKESNRKMIFFVPSLYEEKDYITYKESVISLLYVSPKNDKYADNLTHRDYLGALMNLGIKRETIGDIVVNHENKKEAIIYVSSLIIEEIISNLTKVKNTNVSVKEINLFASPFETHYLIKDIYVSSLRSDSIIKKAFNLSRSDAQELINKEYVFINGEVKSPSYTLKENDRVSIKSKGKFIFLGESTINKKGKYHTKIKLYD